MRLFIAIECPDDVKDELVKVQKEVIGLGKVKVVEYENLHLTLKFLGEVSEGKADGLGDVLSAVEYPPFTMEVGGMGVFPGPGNARVVWAGITRGSQELKKLQEKLEDTLGLKGFERDRRFHPHLTLARVKDRVRGDDVRVLLNKHKRTLFGSFVVGSFFLMKSELSPNGAAYDVVSVQNLRQPI